MRVVWLQPPSPALQGDQVHRTLVPARALANLPDHHVVAGSWLHPTLHQAARCADVLVLCQAVDPDYLPLMAERRAAGLPTVMELNDNFLEPRAFGDVGAFYHRPEHTALALDLARQADALVVSTPYLEELFGAYNSHTFVIPNVIDPVPPYRSRSASPILRLGWAGSAGHAPDIEAALPIVRRVLAKYPQVRLCVMTPEALHPLFDSLPSAQLERRPAADLETYLDYVSSWDVGIAPLVDTPFNRGRSDVKFLEYASRSVAAVVSWGPAYRSVDDGSTGLVAPDFSALGPAVEALLIDAPLRARLSAAAHAYVLEHRRPTHTQQRWQRVLETVGARAHTADAKAWASLAAGPGPKLQQGRLHYLQFGPQQWRLDQLARGSADGERHAFSKEDSYLAPLYAAAACPDDARALQRLGQAQNLAPQSLAVRYHAVRRHAALGHHDQVLTLCDAAWASGLRYAPLLVAAALAHGHLGHAARKIAMLQSAVELKSCYWPAAAHLAETLWAHLEAQAEAVLAPLDLSTLTGHIESALTRVPVPWQPHARAARLIDRVCGPGKGREAMHRALAAAEAAHDADGLRACSALLAQAAHRDGDRDAALRFLRRAQSASQPAAPKMTHPGVILP